MTSQSSSLAAMTGKKETKPYDKCIINVLVLAVAAAGCSGAGGTEEKATGTPCPGAEVSSHSSLQSTAGAIICLGFCLSPELGRALPHL